MLHNLQIYQLAIVIGLIVWFAVIFGINSIHNMARQETVIVLIMCLTLYLHAQLITSTTTNHNTIGGTRVWQISKEISLLG